MLLGIMYQNHGLQFSIIAKHLHIVSKICSIHNLKWPVNSKLTKVCQNNDYHPLLDFISDNNVSWFWNMEKFAKKDKKGQKFWSFPKFEIFEAIFGNVSKSWTIIYIHEIHHHHKIDILTRFHRLKIIYIHLQDKK